MCAWPRCTAHDVPSPRGICPLRPCPHLLVRLAAPQACNNRVVHRSNHLLGWAGNDFRYQVWVVHLAQLVCDGLATVAESWQWQGHLLLPGERVAARPAHGLGFQHVEVGVRPPGSTCGKPTVLCSGCLSQESVAAKSWLAAKSIQLGEWIR